MLKGGLRDRISQGLNDEVAPPQDPAKLLDDLARALKLAADRASTVRPSQPRSSMPLDAPTNAEPTPVMPQILQVRSLRNPGEGRQRWPLGESIGRLAERTTMGPAVLVAGLATVGLMLLISVYDAIPPREKESLITGVSSIGSPAQPPTTSMTTAALDWSAATNSAASSPDGRGGPTAKSKDALSANATMANGVRIVSIVKQPRRDNNESQLLADCAAHIQQGNIRIARDKLARAASAGSLNAKFALAETFDPNMLAAWGRSEQVGDAKVALKLYEQVLARGEARARHRIEALKGDR